MNKARQGKAGQSKARQGKARARARQGLLHLGFGLICNLGSRPILSGLRPDVSRLRPDHLKAGDLKAMQSNLKAMQGKARENKRQNNLKAKQLEREKFSATTSPISHMLQRLVPL